MNRTIQKVINNGIEYGAVFTEAGSPCGLAVSFSRFVLTSIRISEAEITLEVQLLKEQNKYDQIPLNLFDRLQRDLPLRFGGQGRVRNRISWKKLSRECSK